MDFGVRHQTPIQQQRNYAIINPNTEEVIFQGDFTKYYMNLPYIAVFETYPAASTKIWICQRVNPTGNQVKDKRVRVLMVRQPDGKLKQIGYYIRLSEVSTESEANEKISCLSKGDDLLQRILSMGDKQ